MARVDGRAQPRAQQLQALKQDGVPRAAELPRARPRGDATEAANLEQAERVCQCRASFERDDPGRGQQ
jgi:hypothetical protein